MSTFPVCPLCPGAVPPGANGCRTSRLSRADLEPLRPAPRARRARDILGRLVSGVLLYGAAVLWCAWKCPDTFGFVVPAAVLGGGVLHVWKGRVLLGAVVFVAVVVLLPFLLTPSLFTGFWTEFRATTR